MAAKKKQSERTEEAMRRRAARALDTARERTVSAYETARERTSDVSTQLAVYPVAAVLGGLAIGAVLGALVPRTRREQELLGETGRKLVDSAREAARKGIDAGRARADEGIGKVVRAVGETIGTKD